jgi:hypothetical protein
MRAVRLALATALAAGIAMPFAASAAPPKPPKLPDIYWTCRPYIGPNGEVGFIC